MYSAATIKRAQTICARAEAASKQSRKARTRTAARKADPNAWKARPASKAQLARIQTLETLLGYKLSTLATIGTAGEASDLYRSLKAEVRA